MLRTVFTIIFIIVCVLIILFILLQDGKSAGLGALSGQIDPDSYVKKNRGRTREGRLERVTVILGIAFFVIAVCLCLSFFQ